MSPVSLVILSLSLEDPRPESGSVLDFEELSESRDILGGGRVGSPRVVVSPCVCWCEVTVRLVKLGLPTDFTVTICGFGRCRVVAVILPEGLGDDAALALLLALPPMPK